MGGNQSQDCHPEIYYPDSKEFEIADGPNDSKAKVQANSKGIFTLNGYLLSDDEARTTTPYLDLFVKEHRSEPALARLKKSQVLIVGGTLPSPATIETIESTTNAEIFDFAEQKIVWTGKLQQARTGSSATVLNDGRVFIAGGTCEKRGNGAQGFGYHIFSHFTLDSTELFDPVKREFVPGPKLLHPRRRHSASLLKDGRVLLAGGESADIYDPTTNKIVSAARMRSLGLSRRIALPSGNVLFCGGGREAQLFLLKRNAFVDVGPMIEPRFCHSVITLPDGSVLITGGQHEMGSSSADDAPLRTTELFRE